MGNKLQRRKRERTQSKIFYTPKSSETSISLTVPSQCTSPSYYAFKTDEKSTSSASSDGFSWSQMQFVYLQHEDFTLENLSMTILNVSVMIIQLIKTKLPEISADLYLGILKMPDPIFDRMGFSVTFKNPGASGTAILNAILKKSVIHFNRLIMVHERVLHLFKSKHLGEALHLIKQLTVRHALMGTTPVEFRMMDYFIIHYLVKNKLCTDESINAFMIYLDIFSNYIARFYEAQSTYRYGLRLAKYEKSNDRYNKARENFRLMKRWQKQIDFFESEEQEIEKMLEEELDKRRTEEEIQSIDTLTLKENDFIMKHFVKKRTSWSEENKNESTAQAQQEASKYGAQK